jgi:hypothetical protein
MCPPLQRQPTLSKLAPSSPLRYNPPLQGKKDEARQISADGYNWFTEEFDTMDHPLLKGCQ